MATWHDRFPRIAEMMYHGTIDGRQINKPLKRWDYYFDLQNDVLRVSYVVSLFPVGGGTIGKMAMQKRITFEAIQDAVNPRAIICYHLREMRSKMNEGITIERKRGFRRVSKRGDCYSTVGGIQAVRYGDFARRAGWE